GARCRFRPRGHAHNSRPGSAVPRCRVRVPRAALRIRAEAQPSRVAGDPRRGRTDGRGLRGPHPPEPRRCQEALAGAEGPARGVPAVIFASKAFFLFLPVVLVVYHSLRRRRYKYNTLLAASWLVYAWVSPQYLWVILLLTAIDYVVALRIERADDDGVRKW